MPRLVYRRGPVTGKNFTPRPDKDLTASPGVVPGLSVFDSKAMMALGPKGRVQVIDLDLLPANMGAFPDDPLVGGDAGHWSIAPVTPDGSVDETALGEWAATRDTGANHPLALGVQAAVVGEEVGP